MRNIEWQTMGTVRLTLCVGRYALKFARSQRGRDANPPFNISDWGGERLREDARWTYGAPPVGNANYAWLEHILWHLAPNGTAGVVLANGSMSSTFSGEDTIRKGMMEADVVDCRAGRVPENHAWPDAGRWCSGVQLAAYA